MYYQQIIYHLYKLMMKDFELFFHIKCNNFIYKKSNKKLNLLFCNFIFQVID